MLRKALIRILSEYNTNLRRLIMLCAIVGGAGMVIAVLLDSFTPFTGIWNVARSVVLIPLAVSLFVSGYTLGLYLHKQKISEDADWVPYRLRFSLTWRRRIAMIVAAILFVFMYATGFSPVYTTMASIFVACGIATLAFIRATREESVREELSIPDARDLRYNNFREKAEKDRAAEKLAKKEEKKNKNPMRKSQNND